MSDDYPRQCPDCKAILQDCCDGIVVNALGQEIDEHRPECPNWHAKRKPRGCPHTYCPWDDAPQGADELPVVQRGRVLRRVSGED